jgi:hypothetical protein
VPWQDVIGRGQKGARGEELHLSGHQGKGEESTERGVREGRSLGGGKGCMGEGEPEERGGEEGHCEGNRESGGMRAVRGGGLQWSLLMVLLNSETVTFPLQNIILLYCYMYSSFHSMQVGAVMDDENG